MSEDFDYIEMPLDDMPWVHLHSKQDFENYKQHFREIATKAAQFLDSQDSKAINSFLTGAQQALERYNITTRAHKRTRSTTFRFGDTKDDPNQIVTIFLVVDSSRMESQEDVIAQV